MKSKDSPNLYEILRTASRTSLETAPPEPSPAAPACEPHEPTLQDRLAIYKAARLGLAAAVPPAPAAPQVPPAPPAAAAPAAPEAAPAKGPGERVLRITYNTAAFLSLIGIGLLFVAYSLGVRAGRSGAQEAAAEVSAPPAPRAPAAVAAPRAPAPAPAPKVYTIRLVEWPYRTSQERLKANAEAVQVTRGQEPRLSLTLGRYTDIASGAARSGLAAAQKVKVENQAPFAQAQFEEVSR